MKREAFSARATDRCPVTYHVLSTSNTVAVQWDDAWVSVSVYMSVCLSVCQSVSSCRVVCVAADSGALKHDHLSLLVCSIEVDILLLRLSSAACWCVLLGP